MSNAIDTTPLETITPKILNALKTFGIPNQIIKLKTIHSYYVAQEFGLI